MASSCVMPAILYALAISLCDLFKSRRRLQAENLFLRHQLNIALRRALPRRRLRGSDRALLVWMVRLCPGLVDLAQGGEAANDSAVASGGLQGFLALEISESGRATEHRS